MLVRLGLGEASTPWKTVYISSERSKIRRIRDDLSRPAYPQRARLALRGGSARRVLRRASVRAREEGGAILTALACGVDARFARTRRFITIDALIARLVTVRGRARACRGRARGDAWATVAANATEDRVRVHLGAGRMIGAATSPASIAVAGALRPAIGRCFKRSIGGGGTVGTAIPRHRVRARRAAADRGCDGGSSQENCNACEAEEPMDHELSL